MNHDDHKPTLAERAEQALALANWRPGAASVYLARVAGPPLRHAVSEIRRAERRIVVAVGGR